MSWTIHELSFYIKTVLQVLQNPRYCLHMTLEIQIIFIFYQIIPDEVAWFCLYSNLKFYWIIFILLQNRIFRVMICRSFFLIRFILRLSFKRIQMIWQNKKRSPTINLKPIMHRHRRFWTSKMEEAYIGLFHSESFICHNLMCLW